jgi:hypothetical protein
VFWPWTPRVGRTLFALALWAVPAFGAASVPSHEGSASVPDPGCGSSFRRVGWGSVHSFKKYLSYRLPGADNGAFVDAARGNSQRPFALYFHLENAVLKAMNDKYFKDKELSASAVALFEQIFHRHVMSERSLSPDLVYSDYKSVRFAYYEDSPAVRAHLERSYREAAAEFERTLKRFRALSEKYDFEGSALRDPKRWHLAGFGHTADQAATAARFARFRIGSGEISAEDFQSPAVREAISSRLALAETLRVKLPTLFGLAALAKGAAEKIDSGGWVLSPGAIDILRKVGAGSAESYRAEVQGRFRTRFGIELSGEAVDSLQKYFHSVEAFAPSIFELKETLSLGLEHGTEGLVAADLAGQNVRNLRAVMQALAEGAGKPIEKALVLTRAAQEEASARFEKRRKAFDKALTDAGITGKAFEGAPDGLIFSGDDGVFYPKSELTDSNKLAVLRALGAQAIQPDDFRVTFVPARYEGTSVPIPAARRAELISLAESAEKELRARLERHGTPYSKLKQLGVALDLHANGNVVGVDVFLTGNAGAELRPAVEKVLGEVLPATFKKGSVRVVTEVSGAGASYWPRKAMPFVMEYLEGLLYAVSVPSAA